MAVFKNEPEEWQRLDWAILQNGWACLYHRPEFLLIDIGWFRKERYRVIEFDCSKWTNDDAMHADLKLRFRLPESYGNNLHALKDSLSDFNITGAGLVVMLHHFDAVEKETGQLILDVLAANARFHMLLGERVLTLVQVDDAQAKYTSVAAKPLPWNPHEWVNLPGQ